MFFGISDCIVESGRTDAPQLIQVMVASASMTGAFPPNLFDVTPDEDRYQELHVDGGIAYHMFAFPTAIKGLEIEHQLGITPRKALWLIRNTQIDGGYLSTGMPAAAITGRSIKTLTKYQRRRDFLVLQSLAKRDGMELMFKFVPESFDTHIAVSSTLSICRRFTRLVPRHHPPMSLG